jgi:hypothetical protein
MANARACQVYTHFEAWQKAEDQLRTKAREIWSTDRTRAEGMIEAAERIREDRLGMTVEFAGQY